MTSGKSLYWAALLLAVLANVGANAALKAAMTSIPEDAGDGKWLAVLERGSFWLGIALLGVVFVSYLFALRSLPVSVAYVAITSLAMIGAIAVESYFYGIPVGLGKAAGICFIITGIWLITRQT